jgi:hypothetical protein
LLDRSEPDINIFSQELLRFLPLRLGQKVGAKVGRSYRVELPKKRLLATFESGDREAEGHGEYEPDQPQGGGYDSSNGGILLVSGLS